MNRRTFVALAVLAVAAAETEKQGAGAAAGHPARHRAASGNAAANRGTRAAATAIAYAHRQIGKPYLWGGTGPDEFDCSGLVMMAYLAARINIPRTSQEQWAQLPHVPASDVEPGLLVFFPGSDGTSDAPGHVGLVTSPGRMIQAYAPGTGVVASSYGLDSSLPGTGPSGVIGFARPWPT